MSKRLRNAQEVAARRVRRGELGQLKKGVIDLSAPASAVTIGDTLARTNRWRDGLNPLSDLTFTRARALLENAQRGMITQLMWTYGAPMLGIECSNATILALIELRTSAMLDMEWKVRPDENAADQILAQDQVEFLKARYNALENLYEAIAWFELGRFRGFASVQMQNEAGEASLDAKRLALLKQWNFVRDGSAGAFAWNPSASMVSFEALGEDAVIDFKRDLILHFEVPRPINRIALMDRIARSLCEKDWNAFVEIYGIEQPVVIGPPNVPVDKASEYRASAESIASGGGGYMPYGSDVKFPNSSKREPPFAQRLEYLDKQIVLAGTGGMLTMLAEAGSGTLAGGAHAGTFRTIASGSSRRITEVFQRQFDKPQLAAEFPGRPVCAYFTLGAEEKAELASIADTTLKFFQAGFARDMEELQEETGFKFTRVAATPSLGMGTLPAAQGQPATKNRALPVQAPANDRLVAQAVADALQVRADWMAPFFARLETLARNGQMTDEDFLAALEEAANAMPELLDPAHVEEAAAPIRALLGTALVNAVDAKAPEAAT